jgi:5-methylcytosine-specific restriction endonuclease McrA
MKSFYQSKQWTDLAKQHKAKARKDGKFYCVDCEGVTNLESDHVLPRSLYPELRLLPANLCIRCKPCNRAKAAKVRYDWRTFKLVFKRSVIGAILPTIIMTGVYAWLLDL